MRSAKVTLLAVMLAAATAHADYDSEWRDGCPPGNLAKHSDVLAADQGDAGRAYDTRANNFGAMPELDSAFAPTRVALSSELIGYTASHDEATSPVARARLVREVLDIRWNKEVASDATTTSVLSFGFQVPWIDRLAGDGPGPAITQVGNGTFSVYFRHHWLSGILQRRPDGEERVGEGTVAALRHGWALGLLGTAFPNPSTPDSRALLGRTAFESYQFSPKRSLGGAFEYRSEGVGCYAPFFHLRLSGFATWDGLGHAIPFLPETVAVGAGVGQNSSVFFQYGLFLSLSTNVGGSDRIYGSSVIHRFRFAFDWSNETWSWGPYLDLFRGSTDYDGNVLGLQVSWKRWAR